MPYFVLRASGYRFSTTTFRFIPTGAIAVTAVPIGSTVIVEGGEKTLEDRTTAFSTTAFFPDLFPGVYRVTATSPGRSGWAKTVDVVEKQTSAFSYVRLLPEQPEPEQTFDQSIYGIAPSPEGNRYVIWDNAGIHVREIATGTLLSPKLTGILLGDIESISWLGQDRLLVQFYSGVSTIVSGIEDGTSPRLVPLSPNYREVVSAGPDKLVALTRTNQIVLIVLPDAGEPIPTPLHDTQIAAHATSMALHGDFVSYIDETGILWVQNIRSGNITQRTVSPFPGARVTRLIASRHGTAYLALNEHGGAWLVERNAERFELIAEGITSAQFSFDDKKLLLIGRREVSLYALEDRIEQPARTRGTRETITRVSDTILSAEFLTPEEEHVLIVTNRGLELRELDLRGGHNAWRLDGATAYATQTSPARILIGDENGNFFIIPIPIPGFLSQLLL